MTRDPVGVRVEEVRHRFDGAVALDGVDLEFLAGGFNTLLGPSGCGKTTLLRVIAGLTLPEQGRVLIGGVDHTATPPWRRGLGLVFQSYALWPHMSVFDNVAYGLRLRRVPRAAVAERVARTLETVGLTGSGAQRPGQLSGGQQQRVALARALVIEPGVLLLDEPLSNLDARLRLEMRRELRRLQRELGITTIHVTHDQEEALELSDRMAVMRAGRVEQVGTPEEVHRRPRTAAVASFLGASNLIEGEASADGAVVVAGQHIPLGLAAVRAGARVRVAVRPECVRVVTNLESLGERSERADRLLPGEVIECAYLGSAWRATLRVNELLALVAFTSERLEPGQRVGLELRDAVRVDG